MNNLLSLALSALLATGLFNTLLRSLRDSGQAGLARLADNKPRFARARSKWEARWRDIIAALTLLAVTSHIAAVWSAVLLFQAFFPQPDLLSLLAVALYIPLNLTLTRTLPWVFAENYADRITLASLPLCSLLYALLFPLAKILSFFERHLNLRLAHSRDPANRPSAGDEILTLVDQTRNHELEDDERDFIRSALEFGETYTREIMTPRVRMHGLEDTLSVADALESIKDSPFSRFPLYHEDFDEILGMIHVKNLLRAVADSRTHEPLLTHMHPATFVPESMPINDLLRLMKQKKAHTAIAVDEYGGTAGIVTLEDILEELVGEIEDEHDQESKPFAQIEEGLYHVDASMPLHELNEELHLHLPEREEYDSVAGYLLYTLGRIPETGEVHQAPDCEIHIRDATPRRIQSLTLRPTP